MSGFSFRRLGIFGFFFRSSAAMRRATRFSFRSLGIARRSSRSASVSAAHSSHGSRVARPLPTRASDYGSHSSGTRGRSPSRKSRWSWGRRQRHGRGAGRLTLERMEGRSMLAAQSFAAVTLDLIPADDTAVALFPPGAVVSTNIDDYTNVTTPKIDVIGLSGIPMTSGDQIQIVDATQGVVGSYTVTAGDLNAGVWVTAANNNRIQLTTALTATATGTAHARSGSTFRGPR